MCICLKLVKVSGSAKYKHRMTFLSSVGLFRNESDRVCLFVSEDLSLLITTSTPETTQARLRVAKMADYLITNGS